MSPYRPITAKEIAEASMAAAEASATIRVPRHLAPVQPGALRRAGPGEVALLDANGVRHSWRHRQLPGQRHAHETHGGPIVRRQLSVVGALGPAAAGCRSQRWPLLWVAMFGSVWRTARGSAVASLQSRMPNRCAKSAAFSKAGGSRSQPRRGAGNSATQGRRQGCVLRAGEDVNTAAWAHATLYFCLHDFRAANGRRGRRDRERSRA